MTLQNLRETRTAVSDFELRATETGGSVLIGYAAKFNTRSQDLGGWVETIQPGAFTRALDEAHDVRALFNHDPNMVLGRTTAGTLRLEQDSIGLRYEVDLPNTSAGRDLAESLRRGDISQSSFGFRTIQDDWSYDGDGRDLRKLMDLTLYDVSPVTYPAYLDTNSGIAQRSLAKARAEREPVAKSLRAYELEAEIDSTRLAIIALTIGD
ncbi:HK97 family phage prohead protease [Kitasatospora sp. NPDC001309]|uniref:HK97 family phage prohead protease n=1 Tax=Kitasatospora sp. NPDC001309 TaxID=3364013 RepID=UPI003673B6A5